VATKKVRWGDVPGALIAAFILVFLVAAWPTVVFHGSARWIGEALWIGIPALAVVITMTVNYWTKRDERKLKRLRDDRLWVEGMHLAQQQRRAQEQQLQADEQKRRAQIQAAEQQRQRLRDEINAKNGCARSVCAGDSKLCKAAGR
jgi:uncharacterized membrane protein